MIDLIHPLSLAKKAKAVLSDVPSYRGIKASLEKRDHHNRIWTRGSARGITLKNNFPLHLRQKPLPGFDSYASFTASFFLCNLIKKIDAFPIALMLSPDIPSQQTAVRPNFATRLFYKNKINNK